MQRFHAFGQLCTYKLTHRRCNTINIIYRNFICISLRQNPVSSTRYSTLLILYLSLVYMRSKRATSAVHTFSLRGDILLYVLSEY